MVPYTLIEDNELYGEVYEVFEPHPKYDISEDLDEEKEVDVNKDKEIVLGTKEQEERLPHGEGTGQTKMTTEEQKEKDPSPFR